MVYSLLVWVMQGFNRNFVFIVFFCLGLLRKAKPTRHRALALRCVTGQPCLSQGPPWVLAEAPARLRTAELVPSCGTWPMREFRDLRFSKFSPEAPRTAVARRPKAPRTAMTADCKNPAVAKTKDMRCFPSAGRIDNVGCCPLGAHLLKDPVKGRKRPDKSRRAP